MGGGGVLVVAGIYLVTNFPDLKQIGLVLIIIGAFVYAVKELPGGAEKGPPTGAQKGPTPTETEVATADTEVELINCLKEGYDVIGLFELGGKKRVYLRRKR
jgi:hypothetical protein